jgi:hypothetical protein
MPPRRRVWLLPSTNKGDHLEGTMMAKKTERERVEKSLRRVIKQIDRLHAKYGNLDLCRPVAERLAARKPARGGAGHEEDHNG